MTKENIHDICFKYFTLISKKENFLSDDSKDFLFFNMALSIIKNDYNYELIKIEDKVMQTSLSKFKKYVENIKERSLLSYTSITQKLIAAEKEILEEKDRYNKAVKELEIGDYKDYKELKQKIKDMYEAEVDSSVVVKDKIEYLLMIYKEKISLIENEQNIFNEIISNLEKDIKTAKDFKNKYKNYVENIFRVDKNDNVFDEILSIYHIYQNSNSFMKIFKKKKSLKLINTYIKKQNIFKEFSDIADVVPFLNMILSYRKFTINVAENNNKIIEVKEKRLKLLKSIEDARYNIRVLEKAKRLNSFNVGYIIDYFNCYEDYLELSKVDSLEEVFKLSEAFLELTILKNKDILLGKVY